MPWSILRVGQLTETPGAARIASATRPSLWARVTKVRKGAVLRRRGRPPIPDRRVFRERQQLPGLRLRPPYIHARSPLTTSTTLNLGGFVGSGGGRARCRRAQIDGEASRAKRETLLQERGRAIDVGGAEAVHALAIPGRARPDLCGRRHAVHRQLHDVALAVAVVPAGRDPGPGVEHLAARPFAAVLHHHQADELRLKASLGTSMQHWGGHAIEHPRTGRASPQFRAARRSRCAITGGPSTSSPHAAHDARAVDIQWRSGLRADRSKISPGGTLGATSVAMLRSAACSSASSSRPVRTAAGRGAPPLESPR
jgi:hypothetical protein